MRKSITLSTIVALFALAVAAGVAPRAIAAPNALPLMVVGPVHVNFPVTGLGVSPTIRMLRIRNASRTTALDGSIGSITNPAFAIAAQSGSFPIAPGQMVVLELSFTPSVLGPNTGSLAITSNDPKRPSMTITLRGNGAPGLLALRRRVPFGVVPTGGGRTEMLIIRNAGRGLLTGSVAGSLSAPFSIASGSGSFSLQPKQTQVVTVSFNPTAPGIMKQTLAVSSNDPKLSSVDVLLIGKGKGNATQPPLQLSSLDHFVVAGGKDSSGQPLASSEIYQGYPKAQFITGPAMNDPREHAMVVTSNALNFPDCGTSTSNPVVMPSIVAGGEDPTGVTATSEIFNPCTDSFTPGPQLVTARKSAAVADNGTDNPLLIGGIDANGHALASTELVNRDSNFPTSASFSAGPTMSTPRVYAGVATFGSKVFVVGGENRTDGVLGTTEVYDYSNPSAGFVAGPQLNTARAGAIVLLVNDYNGITRSFMVAGGVDSSGRALSSTEVYDPTTNAFVAGPQMPAATALPTTEPFASNTISNGYLIAGGASQVGFSSSNGITPTGVLDSVLVYQPGTPGVYSASNATFTTAPKMSQPRIGASMGILTDSSVNNSVVFVVIAGGDNGSGPQNSVNLYNPNKNTMNTGSALTTAREFAAKLGI